MIGSAARILTKIDVVAFMDHDGRWVAQGIQYDIAASAKSPSGLRKAFIRTLSANLVMNAKLGREGLDGIPPAPERFRALFEEAEEQLVSVSHETETRRIPDKIDMRLVEAA